MRIPRQPLAAAIAAALALAAAGYAAGAPAVFRSPGRPSVTPPPCKNVEHGNCVFGHEQGKGGGHGKGDENGKADQHAGPKSPLRK